MDSLDWGHPVVLEPFEDLLAGRYGSLGLWAPDKEVTVGFEPSLKAAMSVLDRVESAADAVKTLVWTVVPVAVESREYDTGFSDPEVPFTVFLGAHDPAHQVPPVRLAEGLLHEAMHLQLSLVESLAPLVAGSSFTLQSPWQARSRPTQGLLHGLYVFRVVQDFFRQALSAGAFDPIEAAHARLRVEQIERECRELAGLNESVDLTARGRQLLSRLAV